jgi:TM2 domain-containing membrane protein YozV
MREDYMPFCRNCGNELIGNPDICVNCGVILNPNQKPPYHAQQYQSPQYPNPQYQNPQYTNPQYPPPQYQNPQYPNQQYPNPQYPPNQYNMAGYASDKSKITVALLAFFLGTLGVHRFYTGKVGTGIAMAVLTVVGWITSIFIFGYILVSAVGLWALIDFIMALMGKFTDKYGRPIVN